MNYYKMYENVIKSLNKMDTKEERFENLFLLTCMLIDNLSCQSKNLEQILILLQEFDYDKNFRGGK